MNSYRSLQTHLAIQYVGEPIPGVTCEGTEEQRKVNGCEGSRGHMPHVHTTSVGGLDVLRPGDWIMPVDGGPFCRVPDGMFRLYWEVPPPVPPAIKAQTAPTPLSDQLIPLLDNIQAMHRDVSGARPPLEPTPSPETETLPAPSPEEEPLSPSAPSTAPEPEPSKEGDK